MGTKNLLHLCSFKTELPRAPIDHINPITIARLQEDNL